MQKTVFIFDPCGEGNIRFYVIGGDYSHLNHVYINGGDDENIIGELSELLYDESGDEKLQRLDEFPYEEVKQGAKVVVVGFIP